MTKEEILTELEEMKCQEQLLELYGFARFKKLDELWKKRSLAEFGRYELNSIETEEMLDEMEYELVMKNMERKRYLREMLKELEKLEPDT